MFAVRGYKLETKRVKYFQDKRFWQVFIKDDEDRQILCILTPNCSTANHGKQVKELKFTSDDDSEKLHLPLFQGSTKSSSSKKGAGENIGTDFIKAIISYVEKNNIHRVVMISDSVTPQALKNIIRSNVDIVHFTYNETVLGSMSTHLNQPMTFRRLNASERKVYVQKHKRYKLEISRYSIHDALVKYNGMHLGDIVHYQDNDRQTGIVSEYGLIVDDLLE
jgi:hypothetical protein